MARESAIGIDDSVDAAADLSGNQYFAVELNTAGKAVLAGATNRPHGILQNKPTSGKAAGVRLLGISKAVVTGTIAVRDALAPDAAGRLVTTTTDNDEYVAIALEAHTGSASLIRVLCVGGGRY